MHAVPVSDSAYVFQPEDRPILPGAPYLPPHPLPRRIAYAIIGTWLAIAAAFGTALITVNLQTLGGGLGLTLEQMNWLPAAYVAFNAPANLLVVKARQRFGAELITYSVIGAELFAGALQFAVPGFASAFLMRAVTGIMAGAFLALSVFHFLQILPRKSRPLAFVLAIGATQLGVPLARMVPVELLSLHSWAGLHWIELGIPALSLALLTAIPLPPTQRYRVFERTDFVTMALIFPAGLLLSGVLAQGRLLWWTDTPWLGVALASAVALSTVAIVIEHQRANPLLQVCWLGTLPLVLFAIIVLLVRLALAEQSYGSVGLLSASGLTNDQLRTLFAFVALGMVVGIAVCCYTFTPRNGPYLIIVASLAVALGAWLDSHANSLTRPEQLYWSQSLIGLGTTLCLGPALLLGFVRVLQGGAKYLVSVLVIFSTTQNIGGLAGASLMGSYQAAASHEYQQVLAERIVNGEPLAALRLGAVGAQLGSASADTSARDLQSSAALAGAIAKESNVLAFNAVFQLVVILALITVAYVVVYIARERRVASHSTPLRSGQ